MATINMQTMRYINLFDKVSRVKTKRCFFYGGMVIFAVPREFFKKAIGNGGKNIRAIEKVLGKKIKVIVEPRGIEDIERFIKDIVEPLEFKSVEINENSVVISTGSRAKAASLIGRNKVRLDELAKIIEDVFDKELRIVY